MDFKQHDLSDDEIRRRAELYGPLGAAVRELIDAAIRTEVDDDTIRTATTQISDIAAGLRARQIDGAFGVRYNASGTGMAWGNAVVGLANGVAPPITLHYPPTGGTRAEFNLGAPYEGPPGCVHGGICMMVLDALLGSAAASDETAAYTGTITVRFLRPTMLFTPLTASAEVTERSGRKKIVRGSIADEHGDTVVAEGVFILPRETNARPLTSVDGSTRRAPG
ncbi:PaaI family thioesterase [Gordonia pseudamarae]|jgi:acyl-coenzyme A thioesterase PaaI-like protein|uniref:PaaI family thioesterase n=1 Tax=Gordonia pseudamarae TaxID=2831662 RepID=A0ABX6IF33_9ACTN|nr:MULTISPECIES: PaaI family thioesterase [Gordonia]MBD0023449.1 PaaI family thioesterase [Gordonia sp. (in: high G+C Gram-positive bacteria)]QHN25519.1 PaaI family thioesterase [Gordonia pseudamarae]QHN34449.1 PaaI family thioesterase [Gordonia pseudamarae]